MGADVTCSVTRLLVSFFLLYSQGVLSQPEDNSSLTSNAPTTTSTTASSKQTLKASTLLDPPFVMHGSRGKTFEGFAIDILNAALPSLGYANVQLTIPQDDRFGMEEQPGLFNGIIGAVQDKSADLAVGAFTITSTRSAAISFSHPIIHSGFRVLYKIPESWHPTEAMVTLLRPFSPGLWILIVVMSVLASLALYVIGRFSPYEDIAFVGKTSTYEGLTLKNSFLYTFSTLMWQGYTAAPKSISGRIVTGVWWLFAVMTLASYIAGLCVHLFRVNPEIRTLPFVTLDEMTRQKEVALMVIRNSTAHRYLMNNKEGKIEKRILAMLQLHAEDLLVGHVDDGIKKMIESDGKLALLMESSAAEYLSTLEPCDKMVIGEPLGDHSIGFVCRNDTDLCDKISTQILKLQETGQMSELKEKWFASGCLKNQAKSYVFEGLPFFDTFGGEPDAIMPRVITITRFSAAFIILVIGIVIAGIILAIEIFYAKKRGTAVPQRINRHGPDDDTERIENEFRDDDRA